MIIDAKNFVLGRLAVFAAKKALEGEKIDIINCEEAIVTGKKEVVLGKFKTSKRRGDPHKGPYYPRWADRIVRRTIRGMLPYNQPRGKVAFGRVRCYLGVPEDLQNKETVKNTRVLKTKDYLKIKAISKFLGGK